MENRSCFARLLDIRSYIIAVRAAFSDRTVDTGPALAIVALFGLISLCLLPLWISYDLVSTWAFTTTLRDGAAPVVVEATTAVDSLLGMTVGALLAGIILTSFTLLPSLFELAFPTVSHPLLNAILLTSIVFDYVTDYGKAWETTAAWTTNPAAHTIYAAAFCLFVSVGVQALLVLSITAVIYGLLAALRGPTRTVRAQIIDG